MPALTRGFLGILATRWPPFWLGTASHDLTFDHYLHSVFSCSTSDFKAAQNDLPTRPQERNNRRRTLWGTLRIISIRERSWRSFSAAVKSTMPRRQETSVDFPARSECR